MEKMPENLPTYGCKKVPGKVGIVALIEKASAPYPELRKPIRGLVREQQASELHGKKYYENQIAIRELTRTMFYRSMQEGYIRPEECEQLLTFYQLH